MHWIDPESLPEVTGTLERFTLNPKGRVDLLDEDRRIMSTPTTVDVLRTHVSCRSPDPCAALPSDRKAGCVERSSPTAP